MQPARPPGSDDPTVKSESGDDPALADTVAPRLLASESEPGTPFPVIAKANYELLGEHGRGGLGVVLRARDKRLEREVAIKLLSRSGEALLSRFKREALLTARLQHPAIVPVLEAGYFDTGEPFYAMKFVAGRRFKDHIEERKTLAERLALLPNVLVVAEAIAYAHAHGIIHRDLKPSNILVGDFGETVVIDWGLAKDLAAPASEEPPEEAGPYRQAPGSQGLTTAGAIMGTPAYMPPEQAAGTQVDKRADVYALGALLYHTLAGDPPYDGTTSAQIVASVLAGAPPPLAARAPGVPPELLAICAKAMARSPAERYPDGKALADDLSRFLSGRLVAAFSYSRAQLMRRWLARHRLAVAVAGAVVVAGAVTGTVAFTRIVAERDRAESARRVAEQQRAAAQAAERETARQKNNLIFTQAESQLDRDPTATIAWLKRFDVSDDADLRRAKLLAADAVSRGVARHVFDGHGSYAAEAYVSRDGRYLVSVGRERGVYVIDLERGEELDHLPRAGMDATLAFDPDSGVAAYGDGAGQVRVFDSASGQTRAGGKLPAEELALVVPPGGRQLVALQQDFTVTVCELSPWSCRQTGLRLADPPGPRPPQFAANAEYAAVLDGAAKVRIGDLQADKVVWISPATGDIVSVEVPAAGGAALLSLSASSRGGPVSFRAHDRPGDRGRELARLESSEITWVGSAVAWLFSDANGQLRLYEVASGKLLWEGSCGAGIEWIAASRDATRVAAAMRDGRVCAWSRVSGEAFELRGHEGAVQHVGFSAGGDWLTSAGADGQVRVWPMASTGRIEMTPRDVNASHGIWRDEAGRVALAGEGGVIAVYPADGGEPLSLAGHVAGVRSVELRDDGRELLSSGVDGTVRLWDVAARSSQVISQHQGLSRHARFLDGGAVVVSIGEDGTVRLWRRDEGKSRLLHDVKSPLQRLAVAPDGRGFAAGARDGRVLVWTDSDAEPRTLAGAEGAILAIAWSAAGLVVADLEGGVHRFRLSDGAHCATPVPDGPAAAIAVQADGSGTFIGTARGTVQRFEPDDCGLGAPLLRAGGEVRRLEARGPHLVVATTSGELWLVEVDTGSALLWRSPRGSGLTSVAVPATPGPLLAVNMHGQLLRFGADPWPQPQMRSDFVAWVTKLSDMAAKGF